jgi:hypothetical protein
MLVATRAPVPVGRDERVSPRSFTVFAMVPFPFQPTGERSVPRRGREFVVGVCIL